MWAWALKQKSPVALSSLFLFPVSQLLSCFFSFLHLLFFLFIPCTCAYVGKDIEKREPACNGHAWRVRRAARLCFDTSMRSTGRVCLHSLCACALQDRVCVLALIYYSSSECAERCCMCVDIIVRARMYAPGPVYVIVCRASYVYSAHKGVYAPVLD